MQTGLHIGAIVDKQSIEPLTESIVRIIEAKADQKTIRKALEVLSHHAEIRNLSVSGVTVVGYNSSYVAPAPSVTTACILTMKIKNNV